DRQRAIGASADHQPATSPRDVLLGGERGVPVRAAELPGGSLLALADRLVVDDQVMVVGRAVNPDRTEGVAGELHAGAPSPHRNRTAGPGGGSRSVLRSVSVLITVSQPSARFGADTLPVTA